jgi:hypothetical protein
MAILFLFLRLSSFGQDYPFMKDWVKGTIVLPDSSRREGFIKWNTNQHERLRFRETEKGEIIKYGPADILGFFVDTLQFRSLANLEIYGDGYPTLGRVSKVNQLFGRMVSDGKIKIYIVLYNGYDALTGPGIFVNFVFEKKSGDSILHVAYPIGMRMKDKRYEKAKEGMYLFFEGYPGILSKIKAWRQEKDFFEIIDLVKQVQ